MLGSAWDVFEFSAALRTGFVKVGGVTAETRDFRRKCDAKLTGSPLLLNYL